MPLTRVVLLAAATSLALASPATCGGGSVAPVALAMDPAGNAVFEPGETAVMAPTWRNAFNPATLGGATSSFTGPAGAVYANPDTTANYGLLPMFGAGSCLATGDCYTVRVTAATRPATHWDSTIVEFVNGVYFTWTLHIGASFTDVSTSSGFYRFIETILHKGVTGGCTATAYCPTASTTREQMAVFVLRTLDPALNPPACGTPMFADVPASSPFCRWIEELARRGVVTGCGGGNYCPTANVSREQMAVFLAVTFGLTLYGL